MKFNMLPVTLDFFVIFKLISHSFGLCMGTSTHYRDQTVFLQLKLLLHAIKSYIYQEGSLEFLPSRWTDSSRAVSLVTHTMVFVI